MKTFYSLVAVLILLASCNQEVELNSLNVAGILQNGTNTEAISLKLEDGAVSVSTIECFTLSSTIVNASRKAFGYFDCNEKMQFVDLTTGSSINSFELPGTLQNVVVDEAEDVIVGHYFKDSVNRIAKISMKDGTVVTDNEIKSNENIFACTQFYNSVENSYSYVSSTNKLITLNSLDGSTIRTVSLDKTCFNLAFNQKTNQMVGLSYNPETQKNSIEVINALNGETINSFEIEVDDSYIGCVSSILSKSKTYITVTSDYEILFFDIETGKLKDSYQLEYNLNSIQFWSSL